MHGLFTGVTFAASPRSGQTFETRVNYLTIEKAGLLDFVEMSYTPALRIDYSYFKMSHITVRDSVSDGFSIKYCHPYSQSEFLHVTLENNLGRGFLTRSPFLYLKHLTITGNKDAGLVYDPMFTEYEALSVRNFMSSGLAVSLENTRNIDLSEDEMKFVTTRASDVVEDTTYVLQVRSVSNIRITVQMLDYSPRTDIEKVVFYGSDANNWQTAKYWSVEEDLVDFPIVSPGAYLTIRFTVRGLRSGRLAFAVIASKLTIYRMFQKVIYMLYLLEL